MDYKGINLNKIDKMAGLALKNGLCLHFDSILLFKNKSFPSAFFLSVLAIEEIGKSFMLMDFLFHSIEGRGKKQEEEEYFKHLYCHTAKQWNFAFQFDAPIPFTKNRFFKTIFSGKTEKLKQDAVYVGLSRDKGKINLKSKINNPLKISRSKAFEQITNVNNCLLELTLGTIKEIYFITADSVESLLNKKLFDKLEKSWPFIKNRTKARLVKIRKVK